MSSVARPIRCEPQVWLEALSETHFPAFADLVTDPSLASIPVGRCAGEQGAGACFERLMESARHGRAHWFAIIDAAAGFVGQVGLVSVHRAQAQLTYWIAAPYRMGGRATAAARQVMEYAFERARIERLTTVVRAENAASRRTLDKLGFVRAPTLDPGSSLLCFMAENPRPSPAARFARMLERQGRRGD